MAKLQQDKKRESSPAVTKLLNNRDLSASPNFAPLVQQPRAFTPRHVHQIPAMTSRFNVNLHKQDINCSALSVALITSDNKL